MKTLRRLAVLCFASFAACSFEQPVRTVPVDIVVKESRFDATRLASGTTYVLFSDPKSELFLIESKAHIQPPAMEVLERRRHGKNAALIRYLTQAFPEAKLKELSPAILGDGQKLFLASLQKGAPDPALLAKAAAPHDDAEFALVAWQRRDYRSTRARTHDNTWVTCKALTEVKVDFAVYRLKPLHLIWKAVTSDAVEFQSDYPRGDESKAYGWNDQLAGVLTLAGGNIPKDKNVDDGAFAKIYPCPEYTSDEEISVSSLSSIVRTMQIAQ